MSSQLILPAIQACEPLAARFRSGGGQVELEARLGRCAPDAAGRVRFQPGVEPAFFRQALELLQQYTEWANQATLAWVDSVDFYFGDLRATAQDGEDMVFIEKKNLASVDLVCAEHPYDVRVSAKRESPASGAGAAAQEPTLVRLKRRMSFLYRRAPEEPVSHRFDLTVVQAGSSKWVAAHNPSSVTHEVEVEVCADATYLAGTPGDADVAASLLEKMVDLVTLFRRDQPYSLRVHVAGQPRVPVSPTARRPAGVLVGVPHPDAAGAEHGHAAQERNLPEAQAAHHG